MYVNNHGHGSVTIDTFALHAYNHTPRDRSHLLYNNIQRFTMSLKANSFTFDPSRLNRGCGVTSAPGGGPRSSYERLSSGPLPPVPSGVSGVPSWRRKPLGTRRGWTGPAVPPRRRCLPFCSRGCVVVETGSLARAHCPSASAGPDPASSGALRSHGWRGLPACGGSLVWPRRPLAHEPETWRPGTAEWRQGRRGLG